MQRQRKFRRLFATKSMTPFRVFGPNVITSLLCGTRFYALILFMSSFALRMSERVIA